MTRTRPSKGELGLGPKRKTCDSFYERSDIKTEQVYRARRAVHVFHK